MAVLDGLPHGNPTHSWASRCLQSGLPLVLAVAVQPRRRGQAQHRSQRAARRCKRPQIGVLRGRYACILAHMQSPGSSVMWLTACSPLPLPTSTGRASALQKAAGGHGPPQSGRVADASMTTSSCVASRCCWAQRRRNVWMPCKQTQEHLLAAAATSASVSVDGRQSTGPKGLDFLEVLLLAP